MGWCRPSPGKPWGGQRDGHVVKELQGQGLSRLGGHGHFPAVGRERHPDGGKSGWGCLGGVFATGASL